MKEQNILLSRMEILDQATTLLQQRLRKLRVSPNSLVSLTGINSGMFPLFMNGTNPEEGVVPQGTIVILNGNKTKNLLHSPGDIFAQIQEPPPPTPRSLLERAPFPPALVTNPLERVVPYGTGVTLNGNKTKNLLQSPGDVFGHIQEPPPPTVRSFLERPQIPTTLSVRQEAIKITKPYVPLEVLIYEDLPLMPYREATLYGDGAIQINRDIRIGRLIRRLSQPLTDFPQGIQNEVREDIGRDIQIVSAMLYGMATRNPNIGLFPKYE